MNSILHIIVNTFYIISFFILVYLASKYIRLRKGYIFAAALVVLCWTAGDFLIDYKPTTFGFAIWGCGHLLLLIFLAYLFGEVSVYFSAVFMLLISLVLFTGHFWPKNMQGEDKLYVIYSTLLIIMFANIFLLAYNKTENRWTYVLILCMDFLLILSFIIAYRIFAIRIDIYNHNVIIINKGIKALLFSTIIYKYWPLRQRL